MGKKIEYKIKPTRHGTYDFYLYVNGKPIAVSIDSYATSEGCEKIAKLVTEDEAIKVGDQIRVNTVVTTVLEIKYEFGDVFYSTKYGDFNSSVCQKV